MTKNTATPPKRENLWLNLGLNVVIPSLIMMKGEKLLGLQFEIALIVALAFPVSYGIYDFVVRGKKNIFSVLGFAGVLLTGGFGLLRIDKDWFAVKEAAIPLLIAIALIVSLRTRVPLIRTLLYTPEIFDVGKIQAALQQRGTQKHFDRLMAMCTLYLAGSFLMSAALNYALARYFIRSEMGTPQSLEEIGRMTLWSYPVILVPSMAVMLFIMWRLFKGIEAYTGYEWEDVVVLGHHADNPSKVAKDVAAEPAADEQTS